jgi:ABC-type nickel/cobalt efflux system permease component RcnA
VTRRLSLPGAVVLAGLGATQAFAQARMPFGIGGTEGMATPPGNALAAFILEKQSEFYRAMSTAVHGLATNPSALWTLLGIGFLYGIFHAAGPGHGKAVISSYIIADARALRRGFALALAAALFQGLVAIALVGLLVGLLGFTAIGMTNAASWIETLSYVLVICFGLWLIWRKGRAFLASFSQQAGDAGDACDHVHLPPPEAMRNLSLREAAAVAVAAGSRPCTGAILILVFTLVQAGTATGPARYWLLGAGVAAVVAISLGTAITTGAIAAVAVFAKKLALGLAAGRSRAAERIGRGIELLAAIALLLFGVALLAGYLATPGAA